ncbi:MAG: N-6 DNA methylase, partial [Clostridia bacterium]|nr:N-6 DNA methylase [Clostridia bacterium]
LPEIRSFITEDEIREALSHGSGFSEGKQRIADFFEQNRNTSDRANFLKNEYGIGGRSHAVSQSGGSFEEHSSKGIKLRKKDCQDVELSWVSVVKRIDSLIKQGRYIEQKQDEPEIAEANEEPGNEIAQPVTGFDPNLYNRIKEQYPDNMVLFQVGDFFELFGEDARTAADELDLVLTSRTIDNIGKVDMCGFPSFNLEKYAEKLRDKHDIAINGIAEGESERKTYTLLSVNHEAERDIDRHEAEYGADGTRVFSGNEETEEKEYTTEQVAVYPAEENRLPYDIVLETIKFDDPEPKPENFRITDFNLGEGGPKAKFRANMDAINTLKQIEFDGRVATPEEQETLSRYVGWGGLSDAFDETKENWKDEYLELYAALTPEEYEAARASTLNAHYTSPTVIKSIYDTLANLGFQSGNILEPSMGVGNFFGMLPDEMKSSKLYGVELDSITGRIAKLLYPEADITVAGFETTNRKDFYDVAVGNVPFGNYKVNDREYNKLGFSIHDYFFAKALDQIRPGGVIAFVTSRYTMDSKSPEVRRYLAERAELLGAIRLPNNAFKANAGTDVVSDILFFQKKEQPFVENPEWVFLGQNEDGFSINQYFIDRPDMMLGVPSAASTQYGKEDFTLNSKEDEDL